MSLLLLSFHQFVLYSCNTSQALVWRSIHRHLWHEAVITPMFYHSSQICSPEIPLPDSVLAPKYDKMPTRQLYSVSMATDLSLVKMAKSIAVNSPLELCETLKSPHREGTHTACTSWRLVGLSGLKRKHVLTA